MLSKELLEMGGPGADNLIRTELTGAIASTVDAALVSALLTGLTAIPSQGGTALGVRQDLRALVDAIDAGASIAAILSQWVAGRPKVGGAWRQRRHPRPFRASTPRAAVSSAAFRCLFLTASRAAI